MPPTRMKRVFVVTRGNEYITKTGGGRHRWTTDRDKAQVFQYVRSAAHVATRYGGLVHAEERPNA
jgi:hypothetical protein